MSIHTMASLKLFWCNCLIAATTVSMLSVDQRITLCTSGELNTGFLRLEETKTSFTRVFLVR